MVAKQNVLAPPFLRMLNARIVLLFAPKALFPALIEWKSTMSYARTVASASNPTLTERYPDK